MAFIDRILVATDCSTNARAAFEWGALVAARFDASLDVIHTWNTSYAHPEGLAKTFVTTVKADEEKSLKAFVSATKVRGPSKLRRRLEHGDAAMTILQVAMSGAFQLVVLGTHGEGPASRANLGRVADQVVRSAPCPVLLVPPSAHAVGPDGAAGDASIRSLMLSLDSATDAAAASSYAASFAEGMDVSVAVLRSGDAAPTVHQDLVVMDARGRGEVELGKSAKALMTAYDCPVLVVRDAFVLERPRHIACIA